MENKLSGISTENEKTLKTALRREIGRMPDKRIWAELAETGLLEYAHSNRVLEIDAGWLAELAADYREREEGKPLSGVLDPPPDEIDAALARILAAEASRDEEIIAFRQRVLRGKLVPRDDVEDWIEGHAAKQDLSGFATALQGVVASHGGDISTAITLVSALMLAYVSPLDQRRRVVRTTPSGPLAELRTLALRVQARYGWREHWAATFVLTGVAPPIPRVRVGIDGASGRINLDVSPRVAVPEILGLYQRARDVLKGPDSDGFRPRPPKPGSDTLALAVFAAEQNDGRSWAAILEAWNASGLGRTYSDRGTFTTAAQRAYRFVTGRRLLRQSPTERSHK